MSVYPPEIEDRWQTQPKMPSDRPPTKLEVWAWVVHMYGPLFEEQKLRDLARDKWAWSYIYAVNFNGWRKHPDWVPGESVVADATPVGPIEVKDAYFPTVEALWAIAHPNAVKEAA